MPLYIVIVLWIVSAPTIVLTLVLFRRADLTMAARLGFGLAASIVLIFGMAMALQLDPYTGLPLTVLVVSAVLASGVKYAWERRVLTDFVASAQQSKRRR